jgi:hypothetical protein
LRTTSPGAITAAAPPAHVVFVFVFIFRFELAVSDPSLLPHGWCACPFPSSCMGRLLLNGRLDDGEAGGRPEENPMTCGGGEGLSAMMAEDNITNINFMFLFSQTLIELVCFLGFQTLIQWSSKQ